VLTFDLSAEQTLDLQKDPLHIKALEHPIKFRTLLQIDFVECQAVACRELPDKCGFARRFAVFSLQRQIAVTGDPVAGYGAFARIPRSRERCQNRVDTLQRRYTDTTTYTPHLTFQAPGDFPCPPAMSHAPILDRIMFQTSQEHMVLPMKSAGETVFERYLTHECQLSRASPLPPKSFSVNMLRITWRANLPVSRDQEMSLS
jgi:hypothetical protein